MGFGRLIDNIPIGKPEIPMGLGRKHDRIGSALFASHLAQIFFQAHDGLLDPVERNGSDVLGFQRGRRLQLSRHADVDQLQ